MPWGCPAGAMQDVYGRVWTSRSGVYGTLFYFIPLRLLTYPRGAVSRILFRQASVFAAYPGEYGRSHPTPCLALLRMGVAKPVHRCTAGELLPHLSTLALQKGGFRFYGPIRGSRHLAVSQHLAHGVRTFLRSAMCGCPRLSAPLGTFYYTHFFKPE